MKHHFRDPQKGSLVLVVLCFVAVLGIGLASYLAVSNQSMKLSDRSSSKEVSGQLAEMGLEQALLAFNRNDWSGWTISGTTAKRTTSFPSTKYGSRGLTGSINLRVDHYNAAPWNAAASYTTNDIVWHRGVWFQCKSSNTNQTPPNSTYWIGAPAAWSSDANYNAGAVGVGDVVFYAGHSYRCIRSHINHAPPNATCWAFVSAVVPWSAATSYAVDNVALLGGTAYRCIAANSNQTPPNAAYWLSSPVIYAEGVATLPDSGSTAIETQLRASLAPAPQFPNAAATSSTTTFSAGGTVDSYNSTLALGTAWNSGTTYEVGDNVLVASILYRCVLSHTNQTPPNATYWSTSPLGYSAVLASTSTSNPAVTLGTTVVSGYVAAPSGPSSPYLPLVSYGTATVKGATSPGTPNVDLSRLSRSPFVPGLDIAAWDATTGYRVNDVVRSGSSLYLCKLASVGVTPPSASYWTPYTSLNWGTITSASLGTIGATNPSNYTYGNDLYLDDGDTVTIQGPVILDIRGELHLRNGGQIILTNNGSAEIHIQDRFSVGSGSAATGINNQTKDPKKLLLIGTVTSNSPANRYYATSPFYGVIHMPNLSGAFDIKSEFFGAISAKSVTFSTAAKLHYDTSLRTAVFHSLDAPFILTEWRELTDATERVTLP